MTQQLHLDEATENISCVENIRNHKRIFVFSTIRGWNNSSFLVYRAWRLLFWPRKDAGYQQPSYKPGSSHDDVIKWKHFPCYWPFVRGIHWSPVNSLHNGQWRGDSMFSLICAWINGRVNNREAGDLRHNRARYDVIVMCKWTPTFCGEYS